MSQTCTINNCQNFIKVKSRGLCGKHYQRWWNHGDPSISSPRDPRPILTKNKMAYIPLGVEAKHGYATIDPIDVKKVQQYKWTFDGRYPITCVDGRMLYLHHLIAGKRADQVIDHVNGDKFDARRANLRHVSYQVNSLNRHHKPRNGYMGIYFDRSRNTWCAQMQIDGRNKNLGRFPTRPKAVAARQAAERKYFPEIADMLASRNAA